MTKNGEIYVEKLVTSNQEHLFAFLNEIKDVERKKRFMKQLEEVNVDLMKSYWIDFSLSEEKVFNEVYEPIGENIKNDCNKKGEYYSKFVEFVKGGKLGVVLLAGGQATRLGIDFPKGMYKLDIFSGRSLFELQASQIFRLCKKYDCSRIPFYVMTSEATDLATRKFFEENSFFGLEKADVMFFQQSSLPCLSLTEFKLLLSEKDVLATSPNGNGGIFFELARNKEIMQDMVDRGLVGLHVYCVDNVLVKILDPYFMGFCLERNLDCGLKVVKKMSDTESVGTCVVSKSGNFENLKVIEYSELCNNSTFKQAEQNNFFDAANICNHYFSVNFLFSLFGRLNELKPHYAVKNIKDILNFPEGSEKKNGVKLEYFIFDVLPFCKSTKSDENKKYGVYYSNREEEFSPLKNNSNQADCNPETCKRDYLQYNTHLLKHQLKLVDVNDPNLYEIDTYTYYFGEEAFDETKVENVRFFKNSPEDVNE